MRWGGFEGEGAGKRTENQFPTPASLSTESCLLRGSRGMENIALLRVPRTGTKLVWFTLYAQPPVQGTAGNTDVQ